MDSAVQPSVPAPSTVALSAYNLAVDHGGTVKLSELPSLLEAVGHPASPERLTEALDGLVSRERAELVGGELRLKNPQRGRVVQRDLSGNGWGAWMALDPRHGVALLDAVTT